MRTYMRKALGALARDAISNISTKARSVAHTPADPVTSSKLAHLITSHTLRRDYYHQVHPVLDRRLEKGRPDYVARIKEHDPLYARLIDVVGGPDGGFDLNGADRYHYDFCTMVVNGRNLSMCKVASC
jgi:hypothetical protein|tara:strand:+ start:304 stop:687 length:384 start_codon:yes stop_codon:yes gene_type:complete